MLSSVQSQSVWLNIQDYDDPITTSLIVSFTFTSTKATASYAISTFLVLSGKCDVTCASCSFTLSQYSCLTCNNFFILAADSSCSLCGIGFYKSTTNVQPVIAICAKCPIEFQSCALVSSKLLGTCNYGYLGAGLFDQACKFR